ncbi:MAG: site-2 protease family protein [Syntrophales bacterium]|nr:site-2 protease family protein [Syntrophales bacterium]MDD5531999.1 site-2 protease family protein [Syntrophales bacterium]HPL62910.1 site-2 protease family protein [Syntrophales bacterium]
MNTNLTEGTDPGKRKIPVLHILLFLLTVGATLVAGSLQQGADLLENPEDIWKGIPFSFTLILILGAHEFGHYFVSRMRGVRVTLPYFIPAPSIIGTFGAFIKMKSPIMDRRTLLDIGVAGPLSGLVVAVPVLFVGLILSEIVPAVPQAGLSLGSSLLFSCLNWIVHGSIPDQMDVMLHPIAFSGWIGLLVTSLNLLPVGQLDGGHVAYAIFGRRQRIVAVAIMLLLVILGMTEWPGWLFWAAFLLFIGVHHPPVIYDWIPLDGRRKKIGWLTLFLFAATFTPKPF